MTKQEFVERMRAERARWQALLAEADEAQMTKPGAIGAWSLKDLVAHMSAYEQGLVDWLDGAARGKALTLPELDDPDVEARNAAIFARYRDRQLTEVLQTAVQVFDQLLQRVEDLSHEDLFDAGRTEWFVVPRWQTRRPLWECIADDSYRHYHQHTADVQAWLGRTGCRSR